MIFALPREKKNTPFLISQGYSEIWRRRGFGVGEGGGGELVLSTEIVNLISHRKKI